MVINDRFPGRSRRSPTADEVAARHAAFQAGRVDGSPCHPPFAAHLLLHRGIEQAFGRPTRQQPSCRFLQRRVVWHASQPNRLDQRRAIGKLGHHAPIVRFEKVLEHQAGKELMLRERLGAVAMRIERQGVLRGRQSGQQDRSRRLTRRCHAPFTNAGGTTVQLSTLKFSTEPF